MQPFGSDGSVHEAIFHDHIYKFRNARIPMHESGWYFHSEEVLRHKHWRINPDDIVADVGACFGSWTIPAALQGARVYAYEPHPLLFTEICHNVAINNLSGNVSVINKAVWSESNIVLDLPHYDLSMIRRKDDQPIFKVQTITLDDSLLNVHRLDWLKIDVEGAEIQVLDGARKLIDKFNPRIIIEWHADRNRDPEMTYLKDFSITPLEPGHFLVQKK